MMISNSWVQLTTLKGALLQKFGGNPLTLVYAAAHPTTEVSFSIVDNNTFVYPAVDGKNIYVKAVAGDVSIASEELA